MIPALEALFKTFPFDVIGFHSDNGSEYINKRVVKLLNKLHIELTKSRSRQTNDNALVESKNGSVRRKILGYCHIHQRFAPLVNEFNQTYLCLTSTTTDSAFSQPPLLMTKVNSEKKYRYEDMMTLYEKLKPLGKPKQYLKKGVSFKKLGAEAKAISDNEAARQLQAARAQLFNTIFGRSKQVG